MALMTLHISNKMRRKKKRQTPGLNASRVSCLNRVTTDALHASRKYHLRADLQLRSFELNSEVHSYHFH